MVEPPFAGGLLQVTGKLAHAGLGDAAEFGDFGLRSLGFLVVGEKINDQPGSIRERPVAVLDRAIVVGLFVVGPVNFFTAGVGT